MSATISNPSNVTHAQPAPSVQAQTKPASNSSTGETSSKAPPLAKPSVAIHDKAASGNVGTIVNTSA